MSGLIHVLLLGAVPAVASATYLVFLAQSRARVATSALPDPDPRRPLPPEAIIAASRLLDIALPAADAEIRRASWRLYPRTPGDQFPDGTPRSERLHEVMAACDLLIAANAYSANPPFEPREILAYWEYRAGALGKAWARFLPPVAIRDLRLQAVRQTHVI